MAAPVPARSGVRHSISRRPPTPPIELRWYTSTTTAAVVRSLGTLDLCDEVIGRYVDRTGVAFLSVGYRRAPDEGSGTTLAEDVDAGLTWLIEHAAELGVDAELAGSP